MKTTFYTPTWLLVLWMPLAFGIYGVIRLFFLLEGKDFEAISGWRQRSVAVFLPRRIHTVKHFWVMCRDQGRNWHDALRVALYVTLICGCRRALVQDA